MERQHTSFRAAVVNQPADANEASNARYSDYVSLVLHDHVWQKSLHKSKITKKINIKDLAQIVV